MKGFLISVLCFGIICSARAGNNPPVKTVTLISANINRIQYGSEKLQHALKQAGYKVIISQAIQPTAESITIVAANYEDPLTQKAISVFHLQPDTTGKEGYSIKGDNNAIIIAGTDASGTLYGLMELADEVKLKKEIPAAISIKDKPQMVLRGACIGMQKPYYLPGRTVYEYPYTPETFPWFYDKTLWIQFLDSLVENRMNSLYLWNGHPFASLVRVKEYPYAVEVDDTTFKKNEEIFKFLTEEADRRGIWVIQMFYNIIVSKPFAEVNHIKTQDRTGPLYH